ncbi:MAG: hypothetical protein JWR80_7065 [Bradyrhizobium sp.]|nr:hypothetical protein [Bradyrhizobium sp.]
MRRSWRTLTLSHSLYTAAVPAGGAIASGAIQASRIGSLAEEDIIQAFYEGNKHKPETTFGNVNADVLADKDPHFKRVNFCSVIRASAWRG